MFKLIGAAIRHSNAMAEDLNQKSEIMRARSSERLLMKHIKAEAELIRDLNAIGMSREEFNRAVAELNAVEEPVVIEEPVVVERIRQVRWSPELAAEKKAKRRGKLNAEINRYKALMARFPDKRELYLRLMDEARENYCADVADIPEYQALEPVQDQRWVGF